MPNASIRLESDQDHEAIHALHLAAFGQPTEAALVDTLRAACPSHLALVAEHDTNIVGHILFTPAHVEHAGRHLEGMGLAPLAVLPAHQRSGIGCALVDAGLARLRAMGCPFVIVLGHPAYYPRFGFQPASTFGIRCQWEVPDEAFMALELEPGVLAPFHGVKAHYHPAFDSVA